MNAVISWPGTNVSPHSAPVDKVQADPEKALSCRCPCAGAGKGPLLSGPYGGTPTGQGPMRVLVAGTSGAGKTTVARRVAVLIDIPHIEIDALFHGPSWTPQDTFESEVHRFVRVRAG